MKIKIRFTCLLSVALCFVFSCTGNGGAVQSGFTAKWKMSTPSAPWKDMPDIGIDRGGRQEVSVNLSSMGQIIDGFGGSFNEKGWIALSLLPQEKREAVLKALFDPNDGAKFNICRIPIGASDYAKSRYTLDETPDDYRMENFSIERDRSYLIPYVKAALRYNPGMRLWGSAWTPPTWMKTNQSFDGGRMADGSEVYDAYALYLLRFIEAYEAGGMKIFCVAVQNEPRVETHYPSCLWTPEQFLVFIRDHIGPLFEKSGMKERIMLGTIQDGAYPDYPNTVLSDPRANAYVSYVGFQWDGLASVSPTRNFFPDKNIMQTETECGNWFWRPDFKFDPDKPQNDWEYGVYTWNKVKAYFEAGVNSYSLWNMVLDEEGKSIDSVRPWPQNAAIVVDRKSMEPVYTPMYWAFRHFSYFVAQGSRYMELYRPDENTICFLNPDGETVIVLQNDNAKELRKTIGIGKFTIGLVLSPMSWSTVVVPKLE